MKDDDITMSDEPVDRLTQLCADLFAPLEADEYSDVQAIIFLNDGERGGVQIHGYDDPTDAMADIFIHMQAVFAASGKRLDFMGMNEDGVTRVEGPDGR